MPLWVSAAGDVFLTNAAGSVARLDTGSGTLEDVAASVREIEAMLADLNGADELLLTPVISELRRGGKLLASGQCYGFTILPIFREGSYKAENRFMLSDLEHIRYTGAMHLKLKEVPDDQSVEVKVL